MLVDWLFLWGVAQGVGVLFYPILQDLAKDGAKDFVKDFFKDSLKHVLLREKDPRKVACGKAIKEFLQLVQQELKFRRLPESEIKQYTTALKKFIHNKSVKEILGKGFELDCDSLDAKILEDTWNSIQLPPLPPKFNWQVITDQYLRKSQEILWESKDLRDILDSQNLESIKESAKETAGLIPDFDLIKYQEAIRERYGNLDLQSLDTSGYAYNELKLWRIFIAQNVREVHEVLPQHELPKEYQRRLKESNQLEAEITQEELERYQRIYFEQPTRSVLDIVNDEQNYKYLVILGDPGSGKSTLLQYLALIWAESPLNNVIALPIPLLIELRTYVRNKCNNFLDFFHQSPSSIYHLNQHQLHEQLKIGNVVVMFDGLDEVFDPDKREDVITGIHRFTNVYPNARVIVTSRTIGYKPQRLRDAQFRHLMLQDLEIEQIRDFVYRWHELTFKDEVDKVRKRERLQTAIDTSSSIRELAGNPLLLTMMAILNRNQELPKDRPELYNQASRVLLHQWDVERVLIEDQRLDPKTIDYKDKQAMLRQVAYYMQANEKGLSGNLIGADDLEKLLTDYLKSIEVSDARAIARLMINQLRTRNFILCFLGADYYAFVHRTFLEYFCAWEFVWQFEKERKISFEELKTEVFGKHWQDEYWHEVLRLITGMIEPKFAGEIIDYLIEQNGKKGKFLNIFLAAKCFSEVRNRNAIAPTSTRLLARLKDIANNNVVRIATVRLRSKERKDYPNTLACLKTITQPDDGLFVQSAAVEAIAQGWKDDPNTLAWLKTIAQSDDWVVRSAAVEAIAQGWKDDPNTLAWLKTIAQLDKSYVRITAVEAIAQGWKDDPNILAWLKTIAQSDDDWYVRSEAVGAIAYGWKDEPGVFEFLCDRAIIDPFKRETDWQTNPRQAALEAIIEHYPDHPQILPLLRDRAENDSDEQVREFARQKLADLEN